MRWNPHFWSSNLPPRAQSKLCHSCTSCLLVLEVDLLFHFNDDEKYILYPGEILAEDEINFFKYYILNIIEQE